MNKKNYIFIVEILILLEEKKEQFFFHILFQFINHKTIINDNEKLTLKSLLLLII